MWAKLYRILLDEFGPCGELTHDARSTPSACARSIGNLTDLSLVDRGKKGLKIHLIADRTGLPISVAISAASTYDSLALESLARSIPPIPLRGGPRRHQPAKPHDDKSYDYAHL